MKKYLFIGLVLLGGFLVMANYQDIFDTVVPPNPEILNDSADGSSSSLFNYSIKIKGEVRNNGGHGYVIVRATAIQEGKEWERTQKIYLSSYETQPFEFVFDEVKLLKQDPTYRLETYAMGSVFE